jgi:retron-type reverse transcriptase
MVKAGYIEWKHDKREIITSGTGVPQGGIISPILSNLVLHELDEYVERLKRKEEENNIGLKTFSPNPKYSRMSNQIARTKKNKKMSEEEKKETIRRLVINRRRFKTSIPNPKYIRIEYVRYADD